MKWIEIDWMNNELEIRKVWWFLFFFRREIEYDRGWFLRKKKKKKFFGEVSLILKMCDYVIFSGAFYKR